MAMAPRQFEVVPDEPRPDPADSPGINPPTRRVEAALVTSLLLALKAISQRAFVALLDCFALVTAGAVFWLFYSFDNPTAYQIAHATIFACFVLSLNFIVRMPR